MMRTRTLPELLTPLRVMEVAFLVVALLLLAASCRPAAAQSGWSIQYWQPGLQVQYQSAPRGYAPNCGGYGNNYGYNDYDRDRELRRQDRVLRAQDRVLREREDVAQAYAKWQGLRYSPDHSSERAFVRWQRSVVAAERNLLRQQDDLAEAERALREASWSW